MKNILITGMSGLIGGLLKNKLQEIGEYKLTAHNRTKVDGENKLQADISN